MFSESQTDKMMVHDKAGKLEAKERKHDKEAKAKHVKDQKKVDNANQAGEAKTASKETHTQPDLTIAARMTNQGLA